MSKSWPRMLLTLFLVVTGSAPARAQGPSVADSPAERQFRAWLAVFNQGERAALTKFINDNYPSGADRVDNQMNFRAGTGGFDFRKTVSATATQFTALVQEIAGRLNGKGTAEEPPLTEASRG